MSFSRVGLLISVKLLKMRFLNDQVYTVVRFLASDKTHVFDIQQVYIDLYERGFIEKEDVDFIHAWVQTFDSSYIAF